MEYRRLAITGPIEDATPSCVIVDVARAHDYEIAIDKIVLNPKYRQKVLEALATKHVSVQWELPNRYIRNHRLHQYVNATMVKSSSLSLPTTLPLMITTTSSSTSTSTDSSSEKFTMESLFQCIQFMHSFEGVWNRQRDVDWTILDDCEPGDPTPSNFRRLNASVLYAIVRYCRISVGPETTMEDMWTAIHTYRNHEWMREVLLDHINSADPSTLTNWALNVVSKVALTVPSSSSSSSLSPASSSSNLLAVSSSPTTTSPQPSQQQTTQHQNQSPTNVFVQQRRRRWLQDFYERRGREIEMRRDTISILLATTHESQQQSQLLAVLNTLHRPRTHLEAIAFAAIDFRMDLRYAWNPLREYVNAERATHHRDRVRLPSDNGLRERLRHDKMALDLTQRFYADAPRWLYHELSIEILAKEEGWTLSLGIMPYEFLCNLVHRETFYAFGRGPAEHVQPLNKDFICDGTPVSSESVMSVVLFGNLREKRMVAINFQELLRWFHAKGNFVMPHVENRVLFETFQINKLETLARKKCLTKSIQNCRDNLIRLIHTLRNEHVRHESHVTHLMAMAEQDEGLKNFIIEGLYLLLHLGKVLRCWHPARDGTLFPYSVGTATMDETEIFAAETIAQFHSYCNGDEPNNNNGNGNERGELLMSLPIVNIDSAEHRFQFGNNAYDGFDVQGRLTIVMRGDNNGSGQSSCIKLSSNWFCCTAHCYLTQFGEPPPFDLSMFVQVG
jgi:hypothetical protein